MMTAFLHALELIEGTSMVEHARTLLLGLRDRLERSSRYAAPSNPPIGPSSCIAISSLRMCS